MRKRERHCRADSELDLNPSQGERMIVGSRRKEKGGGERARPRKLLSISSSRDRLHFLPRPPRAEIVSCPAFPTYAFATCHTVMVLLPCQGRPPRSRPWRRITIETRTLEHSTSCRSFQVLPITISRPNGGTGWQNFDNATSTVAHRKRSPTVWDRTNCGRRAFHVKSSPAKVAVFDEFDRDPCSQ